MRGVIIAIEVDDDPAAWRAAGFTVVDDRHVPIGHTVVHLTRADSDGDGDRGQGITGWTLAGVEPPPSPTIDGLPTTVVDGDGLTGLAGAGLTDADRPATVHPNGVTRIDHVVVYTPDMERTTTALDATGIAARRTRAAGTGRDGQRMLQRFFRLGEVIVEVVGPTERSGDAPARFWGLAHEVTDIDALTGLLGDRVSPPRTAVQQGRRIATLRQEAGLAVRTAFLTPEPPQATTE